MTITIHLAALTHQGHVRDHNEDVVALDRWIQHVPMQEPVVLTRNLTEPIAVLVCDGMGGHNAGEVASSMAATAIIARLQGPPVEQTLVAALNEANALIYREAATDLARSMMGTTVAGLWCDNSELFWYNVGDSSVFRCSNEFLIKLSFDDITGDERRGMLTQSLGGTKSFVPVDPHIGRERIRPRSTYLLCSDGLTDMVEFEKIQRLLLQEPRGAVLALFEAAMAAGGVDNISLVVAAIEGDAD